MIIIAAGVWWAVIDGMPEMGVWFLDVGQGDSILLQDDHYVQVLVDGGQGRLVLSELDKVLPFWDRTIEAVFVTHPHADHIGGVVEVLKKYQVDQIFINPVEYQTEVIAELNRLINEQGAEEHTMYQGDQVQIGDILFESVWPKPNSVGDDINDLSQVLLVHFGELELLLTADYELNESSFQKISRHLNQARIDVLKVPHQGNAHSLTRVILDKIDPKVAIISVGENTFGHPDPAIVEMIRKNEVDLYQTNENGTIFIPID